MVKAKGRIECIMERCAKFPPTTVQKTDANTRPEASENWVRNCHKFVGLGVQYKGQGRGDLHRLFASGRQAKLRRQTVLARATVR